MFSKCPSPMSPLFLLDLHTEVERSWKKPYSAHIFPFPHLNYANVEGLCKPPVEETLASNLSQSEASSLKAPDLSSKPLQTTSRMIGKAYAAAVRLDLQAYQAGLLRDLDQGQELSS